MPDSRSYRRCDVTIDTALQVVAKLRCRCSLVVQVAAPSALATKQTTSAREKKNCPEKKKKKEAAAVSATAATA